MNFQASEDPQTIKCSMSHIMYKLSHAGIALHLLHRFTADPLLCSTSGSVWQRGGDGRKHTHPGLHRPTEQRAVTENSSSESLFLSCSLLQSSVGPKITV